MSGKFDLYHSRMLSSNKLSMWPAGYHDWDVQVQINHIVILHRLVFSFWVKMKISIDSRIPSIQLAITILICIMNRIFSNTQ